MPRFLRLSAVALCLLTAACGGGSKALGGGEDVNACGGYAEYDDLLEPPANDPKEIERYAAGVLRIIDRIDTEERIRQPDGDRIDLPKAVIADWKTIETAMKKLRDDLETDPARAQLTLAQNAEFNAADARLARFSSSNCSQ